MAVSLHPTVEDDAIRINPHLAVTFQRTLRVPENSTSYPLPPGLGRFPIRCGRDYVGRIPESWTKTSDFFIPLYQREALWLGFEGKWWHPFALVIAADDVNVLTGEPSSSPLTAKPQNYIVVPDQPWLDGVRTEKGLVRQFVAWPLGKGLTAAEQIGRRADTTGLQFRVFQGKPNRFPDAEPERKAREEVRPSHTSSLPHLGVGVGGIIRQNIYPDPYGFESWESVPAVTFQVHLLNSEQFRAVTGEEPPPTPISAATYNQHKFPWFELLDEQAGDVGAQDLLSKLRPGGKSLSSDGESGGPSIHEEQIKGIRRTRPTDTQE